MRRPRVAFVALHFAEYSLLLAAELSKQCDVLLVLNTENANEQLGPAWRQRIEELHNVTLVDLPKARSGWMVIKNALSLIREIAHFRPDTLHAQEGIRDELIPALLYFRRIPVVLTIHDPRPHSGRDAARLRFSRLRLYRAVIRKRANVAIVHGALLATELLSEWPRFRGRVRVIPHGPLGNLTSDSTAWETGNLLFFGRIHQYKGLADFVEAVELLGRQGLQVRGVVAGTGDDLELYRDRLKASPLFDLRERFIPPDEVDALFRNAHVVVLPYTDGTQSGVAAMALGYGRPIVATNVGSIPELVREHVNGLLVPPRSPSALSEAIRVVVESEELSRKFADGARELRDGDVSWRAIAQMTQAAYRRAREVLDGGANAESSGATSDA